MESFEEVYQKYLKEVYCFLLRLSGDREIAEELTQQTFAIAFEKLENFRGECKLSVWLCQIAKHEYYAWTKKQKRYANKLDENHADQGEDLLNGIINQENGQIIRKILHDLQEPYKEVFMLRVMGEVSYPGCPGRRRYPFRKTKFRRKSRPAVPGVSSFRRSGRRTG